MEEFIGTIKAFGFNFPPHGWAFCDGQIMSISSNTALFSLIGTTYGGNGQTTFALPDLRGRSIVHPGAGPGLSPVTWGEVGGLENVTLTQTNMPAHVHQLINGSEVGQVNVNTVVHTQSGGSPINETDSGALGFGEGGSFPGMYSDGGSNSGHIGNITSVVSGTTGIAGGSLPFNVRNPYLGIYTSICLYGIFPPRN